MVGGRQLWVLQGGGEGGGSFPEDMGSKLHRPYLDFNLLRLKFRTLPPSPDPLLGFSSFTTSLPLLPLLCWNRKVHFSSSPTWHPLHGVLSPFLLVDQHLSSAVNLNVSSSVGPFLTTRKKVLHHHTSQSLSKTYCAFSK